MNNIVRVVAVVELDCNRIASRLPVGMGMSRYGIGDGIVAPHDVCLMKTLAKIIFSLPAPPIATSARKNADDDTPGLAPYITSPI